MRTKLDYAVAMLARLLREGMEWPDAHTKACLEYDVDGDQLSDLFDARQEDRDDIPDDTPSLDNCDDFGTGEGKYHGRM